jgi:hypothetical protein
MRTTMTNWKEAMRLALIVAGIIWLIAPSLGNAQIMNPTSTMPMPTSSFPQPVGVEPAEDPMAQISYPYASRSLDPAFTRILYISAGSILLLGLLFVIAAMHRTPSVGDAKSPRIRRSRA